MDSLNSREPYLEMWADMLVWCSLPRMREVVAWRGSTLPSGKQITIFSSIMTTSHYESVREVQEPTCAPVMLSLLCPKLSPMAGSAMVEATPGPFAR